MLAHYPIFFKGLVTSFAMYTVELLSPMQTYIEIILAATGSHGNS